MLRDQNNQRERKEIKRKEKMFIQIKNIWYYNVYRLNTLVKTLNKLFRLKYNSDQR